MEFESKMMYKVFWIDGTLKEAYFESKEDAINFKTIMFTAKPEIEVHINKWSWKVLIEKKGGTMENPVYWYDAVIIFGRDSQKVLFKSDHLYEYGDRIVKRYDSGAVVILIIKYGYGSAFPAHELTRLKNASLWPPIISEI